jgi:tRNA uridine 5-carbamoylmethylation protein Kti12
LLVILCGIPCAGKTQLALALAKDLEINNGLDTIVVDPDRIRQMIPSLTSRFDPGRESFVSSLALTMIDESLKHFNIVISDDLNYYESARHRLTKIAQKHHVKYIIIYLTVSVEVAQRRNSARGIPIPQELIAKIAGELDNPGDKYRWDRPSLVIDTEKITPDDAAKQALHVLLGKIKEKTKEAEAQYRNSNPKRVHARTQQRSPKKSLDESTRRALSQLFSSGELDPKRSREANRIRRTYLGEASKKGLSTEEASKEFTRRVKEKLA